MERASAAKAAERALRRIEQARIAGSPNKLGAALRGYTIDRAVRFDVAYSSLGPAATARDAEQLVSRLNLFDADTDPIHYWR